MGLKSKHCTPCEGGNVPKLSQAEAESLRIQVGRSCLQKHANPAELRSRRVGSSTSIVI